MIAFPRTALANVKIRRAFAAGDAVAPLSIRKNDANAAETGGSPTLRKRALGDVNCHGARIAAGTTGTAHLASGVKKAANISADTAISPSAVGP